MMSACNIFGFGGMWPKFGGARLPNGQAVGQKAIVNAALNRDRKRHACRAVSPVCAAFAGPSFPAVAKDSGPTPADVSSQRLGAFRGVGQMQGLDPSRISGKPRSRSGASPHQSSDGASSLMTIAKTFVPCFKAPFVSL
jgi:hypothetical protein